MSVNRRTFLKAGAAAIAANAVAARRPLLAQIGRVPEAIPPITDPRLESLAARALDAAREAGATYADVRLTHTRTRRFFPHFTHDDESMEVGVRALVNGYWGFASGPVWAPDEMLRLGREAAHEGKINALGKPRVASLAPSPVVRNGNWDMPVAIDPFLISPFEVQDFLESMSEYVSRTPEAGAILNSATAELQSKAFASTAGTYLTQRCYRTEGSFAVSIRMQKKHKEGGFALECLTPAGMGYELYAADRIPHVREHSIHEEIHRSIEECKEEMLLPVRPVDVGRFDVVLDAITMASLLDRTIGRATELDRALGYEANAGGTSYLTDPLSMLGNYQVGAPLVTVSANRSEPGSAANVRWDDEGVAPENFTVVDKGVLTDFQTTRESAGWLEPYYTKRGTAMRSHGCAGAPTAIDVSMQHTPNLTLAPAREGKDFDALVAAMGKGIAVKGARVDMDFQAASGLGTGDVFDVKQGKRVAKLDSAAFLFRSSEFWKALTTLGGDAQSRRYGSPSMKGEPAQTCYHSVTAPPAMVRGLTIIDALRKA
jgi:TldD protein